MSTVVQTLDGDKLNYPADSFIHLANNWGMDYNGLISVHRPAL